MINESTEKKNRTVKYSDKKPGWNVLLSGPQGPY